MEASLIRAADHDYQRAIKIPPNFMAEFSEHIATIYQSWVKLGRNETLY